MLCFIALIVFGVLGISSAYYRSLAKEAWQCVGRKIRLKPCDTGLDSKIRAEVMALFTKVPRIANLVYKHFEILAWLFVVVSVIITGYLAFSGYNYYYYGNCNGPNSEGFCFFDPEGHNKYSSAGFNSDYTPKSLILPTADELIGYQSSGQENASVRIIELGCFTCPYTKETAPAVETLVKNYIEKIHFTYVNVPLLQHTYAENAFAAGWCVGNQSTAAFWQFYSGIFNKSIVNNSSIQATVKEVTQSLGLNTTTYETCINSAVYKDAMRRARQLGNTTHIYGTPTFFINNQRLVGPKSYETLRDALEEELNT